MVDMFLPVRNCVELRAQFNRRVMLWSRRRRSQHVSGGSFKGVSCVYRRLDGESEASRTVIVGSERQQWQCDCALQLGVVMISR
jgi:hypothetical protein